MFERCYRYAGMDNKDRIQITPGYGLWTAGIGFQAGAERLGAMVIPCLLYTSIPLTDILMMPDAAILEPKLIESVPPAATAATGMDVLTHAVEAYVSTNNNPFSRCYAAKAAELVFKSLYECYVNGGNLEAKARCV